MKNLVITGDSLSYNRHSYDTTERKNAYDCHIGMHSWSFRLRNFFITSAKGFKFGDELVFSGKTEQGLGYGLDDTDAIFGNRVMTITPEDGSITFGVEAKTEKLVIYFQCRSDNYCRFDIFIDGILAEKGFDTYGNDGEFHGFGLKTFEADCDADKASHKITFSNFEHTEKPPCVTIAGISTELKTAVVTGQGSRTAKFILYHFENRIAKYSPDTLVLIFGGNDCLMYSEKEYDIYIGEIFRRMSERFPLCKIITLTIPPSKLTRDEIRGIKLSSDEEFNTVIVDSYNAVLEKHSKQNGALCIKLKDVFKNSSPDLWRHDNVHFSRVGNDILYNEVLKHIDFKH